MKKLVLRSITFIIVFTSCTTQPTNEQGLLHYENILKEYLPVKTKVEAFNHKLLKEVAIAVESESRKIDSLTLVTIDSDYTILLASIDRALVNLRKIKSLKNEVNLNIKTISYLEDMRKLYTVYIKEIIDQFNTGIDGYPTEEFEKAKNYLNSMIQLSNEYKSFNNSYMKEFEINNEDYKRILDTILEEK
jgi:hypothetical protein